jgi:hypothetical protein
MPEPAGLSFGTKALKKKKQEGLHVQTRFSNIYQGPSFLHVRSQ